MASPELTDPRSARVRKLRRLTRRADRAEAGRFLAEGAQAVREAMAGAESGDVVVHELLVTPEAGERHAALVDRAAELGLRVTVVGDRVAAALSETVTPQGIIAVCELLGASLGAVLAAQPRLVAVLADVRDPGNAGAVIRAADAAGADAVVLAGDSVDPHNGKAVRASAGSLFHLPLVHGLDVEPAVRALREAGLTIAVADGSGTADLDDPGVAARLAAPTAWLFGNEAWGVPPRISTQGDIVVQIPIYGRAESLNLATAATLCLYASRRALAAASGGTRPQDGSPAPGLAESRP